MILVIFLCVLYLFYLLDIIMKDQAEELHRESLELLAKLASSKLPCESENFAYNRSPSKACKLRKNICKGCQQLNCSEQCDKENMPHINIKNTEEVTPKKDINNLNEPLTPTANLKMLVCAASVLTPANSMEEEKRQLFVNDILPKPENNFIQSENKQAKKGQLLGRKEKSLGLLCKRFAFFLSNQLNQLQILVTTSIESGLQNVYL